MASETQKRAARRNVKKAQAAWKKMSAKQHSASQPEGRQRKKPGTTGKGEFYHVVLRAKEQFKTFRTQDVGQSGHSERVAGKRANGSWDTQKWLISKQDAHVDDNGYLRSDRKKVQKIFDQLGSIPKHVKGDIFEAQPRKKVAEKDKPTTSQKKARATNIKKAQAAKKNKSKKVASSTTKSKANTKSKKTSSAKSSTGKSSTTKNKAKPKTTSSRSRKTSKVASSTTKSKVNTKSKKTSSAKSSTRKSSTTKNKAKPKTKPKTTSSRSRKTSKA